jgi:hypothetical protein
MNETILFILLLALGLTCYGLFFLSIKWFDKI